MPTAGSAKFTPPWNSSTTPLAVTPAFQQSAVTQPTVSQPAVTPQAVPQPLITHPQNLLSSSPAAINNDTSSTQPIAAIAPAPSGVSPTQVLFNSTQQANPKDAAAANQNISAKLSNQEPQALLKRSQSSSSANLNPSVGLSGDLHTQGIASTRVQSDAIHPLNPKEYTTALGQNPSAKLSSVEPQS